MKRIIILGASGFIGCNLMRHFSLNKDYDVKGYSSNECNLLSSESINKALLPLSGDDVLIMASAISRKKEDSFDAMVKNISMAQNVSKFIESNKISQLVFLSSVDSYGQVKGEISEKNPSNPDNYYGISKLVSELILKKFCHNIPLFILRLPGVYGEGDDGKSTVGKLANSAIAGKVTIFGDGKDKFDYVYVDDICRIIEIGIYKKTNAVVNIATGKGHSINEIVEFIRSYIKSNLQSDFAVKYDFQKNVRRGMIFDTSLVNWLFPGFKFVDIGDGINLYMKSVRWQ